MKNHSMISRLLLQQKHFVWAIVWAMSLVVVGFWDSFFLNRPAFSLIQTAFINTLVTCTLVVIFSFVFGWLFGILLHFFERYRLIYLATTFVLNIIRSIPQIVGVLTGYVVLTFMIEQEIFQNQFSQLVWMAFTISLFVFLEVVDLIRERIAYFSKMDFFQAMLCCGVKEGRIINREILWKNSRAHILHKLISIFGIAIFLQCSIDFVVSVGLSSDVSLSNFPASLGNQLAKLDSKQDILAIGRVLFHPSELSTLFFEHLQGITIAFVIVFTLLCIYHVSNGIVKKYNL